MGPIGWPELLLLLVAVVLIFGTTRIAGLGKASGRAIREFKEETRGLNANKQADTAQDPRQIDTGQQAPSSQTQPATQSYQQLPNEQQSAQEVYEAEAVDPNDSTH